MPAMSKRVENKEVVPLIDTPVCEKCGAKMRLAIVAPHHQDKRAEIRTYDCECGNSISHTVQF